MKRKLRLLIICILCLISNYNSALTNATQQRVACVGNSITYGAGLTTAQNYPTKLQGLLGTNWLVNNFGVSSRTMLKIGDYPYWNESAYTNSKSFLNNASDVQNHVMIELGTNDVKSINWNKAGANFAGNYKEMISIFRALVSKPEVWIGLLPPAQNAGWDILQVNIVNKANPAIKQIAIETGVGLIDLFAAFNGSNANWYNTTMFQTDAVHPSYMGASLIAQKVNEMLIMPKPILTYLDAKISAPTSFGYQWYFNGTPITATNGGTSQEFTPLQIGNYKVSIKLNANNETRIVSKELSISSLTSKVTEITDSNGIKIYPNPSKDHFIIVEIPISRFKNNPILSVYNETGRLILSKEIQRNKEIIDITILEKGTYLFKLKAEGKSFTTKIINAI